MLCKCSLNDDDCDSHMQKLEEIWSEQDIYLPHYVYCNMYLCIMVLSSTEYLNGINYLKI